MAARSDSVRKGWATRRQNGWQATKGWVTRRMRHGQRGRVRNDEPFDLDAVLNEFEIRVRSDWARREERIHAERYKRIRDAMILDEPRFQASVVRPNLDYYDNLPPIQRKYGQRLG